ncbi:hypothetical protein GOBAR_AA03945 [Gossypium barbadense]|uniref:Uncharacterized protein n=1 Tax=Gossypium barbadense TaxID=3634 RepID=A0A2P5YM04_GOSBA|nr:hypothetical protein GOBAR_AA03945 [Gossypium barbadense]
MNAHLNGEEDDEEEIETVARSADASDKDDDAVLEENADDADDNNKGKERLKYLLQQTELFAHFAQGGPNSILFMGYVGIHSSGFRDFLLKPELFRSIVDSGFEHPSEGKVLNSCLMLTFVNSMN